MANWQIEGLNQYKLLFLFDGFNIWGFGRGAEVGDNVQELVLSFYRVGAYGLN